MIFQSSRASEDRTNMRPQVHTYMEIVLFRLNNSWKDLIERLCFQVIYTCEIRTPRFKFFFFTAHLNTPLARFRGKKN